MKKMIFNFIFVIVVFVVALLSCTTSTTNGITMTLSKSGEVMIYVAGSGAMTIDWGDRTKKETHTLVIYELGFDGIEYRYIHSYSNTFRHTITIYGEKITHFCCSDNQLMSLDVSKNTSLVELVCVNNQLTSLDVSKNTALTRLACAKNHLKSLDVSKNVTLDFLDCGENHLKSLDVSKNETLDFLACDENHLTNLDVSTNSALESLWCNDNQITSLDVSNNIVLTVLGCNSNQLSTATLDALFGTLNNNTVSREKRIFIQDNPGTDTCDRSIATEKGWRVETILRYTE